MDKERRVWISRQRKARWRGRARNAGYRRQRLQIRVFQKSQPMCFFFTSEASGQGYRHSGHTASWTACERAARSPLAVESCCCSSSGTKNLYLRQIAAQFGISLPRNIRKDQSIHRAIGENVIARVSALRMWRLGTGSGVSAAVAVGGGLLGTTEGISAAAAARGDGAGEPAFSGAGAASGAAGSNAAAGIGTVPPCSRRRLNSEATSHGACGEASIAGEQKRG